MPEEGLQFDAMVGKIVIDPLKFNSEGEVTQEQKIHIPLSIEMRDIHRELLGDLTRLQAGKPVRITLIDPMPGLPFKKDKKKEKSETLFDDDHAKVKA